VNEKGRMMGEASASSTIFMGCSIFMMMESEPHYRNKKANEQERKNLLIHETAMHDFLDPIIWHRVQVPSPPLFGEISLAIAAQPEELKSMIINPELVELRNHAFLPDQSSPQNNILRPAAAEANDVMVVMNRTHLVSLLSIT
jgi:hypothetical protein